MSTTQIILTEHIDKLGEAGEIVTVKKGHARNYLLPMGYALLATTPNLLALREQREVMKQNADAKRAENITVKEKLEQASNITIGTIIGPTGKLFGRINSHNICAYLLENFDLKILKKNVSIQGFNKGIDELGTYKVIIELGSGVTATMNLVVIDSSDNN